MIQLTPMNEVGGAQFEGIDWRVQLPDYVPTEAIGVNMAYLGRVARLGGISNLIVLSGSETQESVSLEISGITQTGTAMTSGKFTRQKSPRHTASPDWKTVDISEGIAPAYRPRVAHLDIGAITHELSSRKGGALRQASAWADKLDASLKQGVREAVRESSFTASSLLSFFALEGGTTVSFAAMHHGYSLQQFTADRLTTPIFIAAVAAYSHRSMRETRFSTVMGLHLDRLALAYGGLLVRKLVQPLE